MKRQIFTTKDLKINTPTLPPYPVSIDGSYINAVKHGALTGLIAVFLIITAIILVLS